MPSFVAFQMGAKDPKWIEFQKRAAQRARERREAAYAAALVWHDKVLKRTDDALARCMLELHRPEPDAYAIRCHGCDSEGYDAEWPEWPCRTYVAAARHVGAKFDKDHKPVLED